ncbi:MAG: carbamoyltransferase HypF [Nitrosomonas sp.]|nr:carbamoyltransferase HypF [Nitrosomonas sp.]
MLTRNEIIRRRYALKGAVQGVGFRPFVYHLAIEHELKGWVRNDSAGLIIEVEGDVAKIADFEKQLHHHKPQNSIVSHIESFNLTPQFEADFRILSSDNHPEITILMLPDLAICQDCIREMNDAADRRHRYPFINCTQCGPRFSITTALPYDRPNTSMAAFEMCPECEREYHDPLSRRFHAQPIACAHCGPQLELWDQKGNCVAYGDSALSQAIMHIEQGKIIALKGLGGFHLVADATLDRPVQLLRVRKHRKSKPFAVMYPSLEAIQADCVIAAEEKALLCSAAAPIVLVLRKSGIAISLWVAPNNPYLGAMLPYTPLHHLLLQALKRPIIATSGNRASEPICIDNQEALEQLRDCADFFLVHNRPIINRADDSIVRIMAGKMTLLRRSRGYAPLPIELNESTQQPILGVGGHLKNTIAYMQGNQLMLSPHIGDLSTSKAIGAHEQAIAAFSDLYRNLPARVAHDAHPDYRSTQLAQAKRVNCLSVQHHYAHALACMADNRIQAPCFAVVWDGTGYGEDGTVWGGEFLQITPEGYQRLLHFLPFPLPGGDAAILEPRRSALGILYTLQADPGCLPFPTAMSAFLWQALHHHINTPQTSSVGRLFDAVAVLLGLCDQNQFEGEAAMLVEFIAMQSDHKLVYPYHFEQGIVDWRPMLLAILNELGKDKAWIARQFHNTLAAIIVAAARLQDQRSILLTGGCFQNKLLLETAQFELRQAGFEPYWHHRIPPNDGGLAAGQVMAALRMNESCA